MRAGGAQHDIRYVKNSTYHGAFIGGQTYPGPGGREWSDAKYEQPDKSATQPQLTAGAGLVLRISSISSKISDVNFGMTSSALMFSRTCSGFEAPRMTVLVVGKRATHAKASCETVQPSSKIAKHEHR